MSLIKTNAFVLLLQYCKCNASSYCTELEFSVFNFCIYVYPSRTMEHTCTFFLFSIFLLISNLFSFIFRVALCNLSFADINCVTDTLHRLLKLRDDEPAAWCSELHLKIVIYNIHSFLKFYFR